MENPADNGRAGIGLPFAKREVPDLSLLIFHTPTPRFFIPLSG